MGINSDHVAKKLSALDSKIRHLVIIMLRCYSSIKTAQMQKEKSLLHFRLWGLKN